VGKRGEDGERGGKERREEREKKRRRKKAVDVVSQKQKRKHFDKREAFAALSLYKMIG